MKIRIVALAVIVGALLVPLAASAVNVPVIQGSSYVTAKIVAPTFTVVAQGLTASTNYQLSCNWAEGATGGGPQTNFGPLVDRTNLSGKAAFAYSQPTNMPNPPGILSCNVQTYGSAWFPWTGPGHGSVTFPDGVDGSFWLKLFSTTGP